MEPEVQQKALVLDDNPACLLATSELVASIGYQVREVETTAAAIEAIEHESFDLVVSDISLPGDLNGAQLAQILKQRFPEMPVILMTGHYELKYRISSEFIVLRKPFSGIDLRTALQNMPQQ